MNIYEMIQNYYLYSNFQDLTPKTQKEYKSNLDEFMTGFFEQPKDFLETLEFKQQLQKIIYAIPEKNGKKHDKACRFLKIIKIMCNWAICEGYIKKHYLKSLKPPKRRHAKIDNSFSNEALTVVFEKAPLHLQHFVMFALHTGLRRCDLIRLKYKEHFFTDDTGQLFIKIYQQKTLERVCLAVPDILKDYMQKMESFEHGYVLSSFTKKPWTEGSFRSCWKRFKKRNDLGQATPHGLRKNACGNLVYAGLTSTEISCVMGWSERTVHEMTRVYLVNKMVVAKNALKKIQAPSNGA